MGFRQQAQFLSGSQSGSPGEDAVDFLSRLCSQAQRWAERLAGRRCFSRERTGQVQTINQCIFLRIPTTFKTCRFCILRGVGTQAAV